MSGYQVGLISQKDYKAWDYYIQQHQTGKYYHLSGWKTVIEQAYGRPSYFWCCWDSARRVVGILPIVNIKHFLFGNSLVSMPYLDGGGLLANSIEVHNKLIEKVNDLARIRSIPRIELRYINTEQSLDYDKRDILWSRSDKVRMVLSLPENSELLFKGFKAKLRSQVRKPIKEDLHFILGGPELINDFYNVLTINMRDLGSPVHSRLFFDLIGSLFQGVCKIGVVFLKTMPLAAGIIFCFRDTVSIPWASSLRSHNHLVPNMMLYWEFLKYASDNGYRFFDFGRSSINSGTYRFKAQWGAKPVPLQWQYLKDEARNNSLESKNRYSAFVKLWQRLPISFTKTIGPVIRKYISL